MNAVTQMSPGAMVAQTLQSAEFQAKIRQALPKSISPDRFTRCVITAIQANPGIVEGEKSSLYSAIVQGAQAGLNLDGKEAALVIFNTKVKGPGGKEQWIKKVQFMPMVAGIIKRLGGAGVTVDTQVVYANDEFDVIFGDDPKILHKPVKLGADRGEMIGAYAILKARTGEVYREIMDKVQIEAVRAQSKSPDSLMWTKFASEGWRKTVLRRCAKRVPLSEELVQRTLDADDQAFEFDSAPPEDMPSFDPETVVYEQPAAAEPVPAVEETKAETVQQTVKPEQAKARRSSSLNQAVEQAKQDDIF